MFTGFQAIVRTAKRSGAVLSISYYAPTSTGIRIDYKPRAGNMKHATWVLYRDANSTVLLPSQAAQIFKQCAARLQPRVEEVAGPWRDSYGA